MAGTGDIKLGSLRPGRFESERILLALAISLFIHIAIWAAYEINRELHWMRHMPSIASKAIPAPKIQRVYEEPLEFVTVQAPSAEAPKKTSYFSTQNYSASDDSVNKTAEVQKLNGKQTDMAATAD
ncbi:MAG: hypothetical protein ACRED1_07435, partial [Limisphaerales bacterium]